MLGNPFQKKFKSGIVKKRSIVQKISNSLKRMTNIIIESKNAGSHVAFTFTVAIKV